MVPNVAPSGSSFKGAAAYYLHDKDAESRERVAWTHTENLPTNDPDKAWKVMAWTAAQQAMLKAEAGVKATGRKLEKPVFAFSLSWHPEQRPDKAHMLASAKDAAAALGLAEYQAIYISHNDEPQPHVHVLVNRVHPRTGKAATLSRSKERLSEWALAYEKKTGKVYCQARDANAARRSRQQPERDRNPVIQKAWRESKTGREFDAKLKQGGYTLAQGNKRLVVVDRWGKAHNPLRHLPGVRAGDLSTRLRDVNVKALPHAPTVQKQAKAEQKKIYLASRKYDRWAAQYLNQQQDRQNDERASLKMKYERAYDDKKIELAAFYQTEKREHELQALRDKVAKPGFFRRITGGAARDRAKLEGLEQTFKDIKQRTAEQLSAVTTERDFAIADQTVRHTRENHMAQEYLAEKKPEFYKADERTLESRESTNNGNANGRERRPSRDI